MLILINKNILGFVPGDIIEIRQNSIQYYSDTHCHLIEESITFRNPIDIEYLLEFGEEIHGDMTKVSENPYIIPEERTREALVEVIEKKT